MGLNRAWFPGLKLKCDGPVSNFAFNFNLRRYIKLKKLGGAGLQIAQHAKVWRCRLIL
jgi:heterodisulfide reductase subunit C